MLAEAPSPTSPRWRASAACSSCSSRARGSGRQPLAGLTQLQGLNLSRTPVRDVTALAALGNLQWIDSLGAARPSTTP